MVSQVVPHVVPQVVRQVVRHPKWSKSGIHPRWSESRPRTQVAQKWSPAEAEGVHISDPILVRADYLRRSPQPSKSPQHRQSTRNQVSPQPKARVCIEEKAQDQDIENLEEVRRRDEEAFKQIIRGFRQTERDGDNT